jgi:hypothetical protein
VVPDFLKEELQMPGQDMAAPLASVLWFIGI